MVPTSLAAVPIGKRVSASSVITYFTPGMDSKRAVLSLMNDVSVAPRKSRFSSCSLPRLRSHPIHFCSDSFHRRRR